MQSSFLKEINESGIMAINGAALRDAGIDKALSHAEAEVDGWGEIAFGFLLSFIAQHKSFMAEDLRAAANNIVPEPPSLRAWGGVIARAAKAGIITRVGYEKVNNPRAHCTPAAVWEAV